MYSAIWAIFELVSYWRSMRFWLTTAMQHAPDPAAGSKSQHYFLWLSQYAAFPQNLTRHYFLCKTILTDLRFWFSIYRNPLRFSVRINKEDPLFDKTKNNHNFLKKPNTIINGFLKEYLLYRWTDIPSLLSLCVGQFMRICTRFEGKWMQYKWWDSPLV